MTNQEYFERLGRDPQKWGNPVQALLGLIKAEMAMETPAIGGKDSMSGTFNNIHVPPTLITFAVAAGDTDHVVSASLKETDSCLYLLRHTPENTQEPDYEQLRSNFLTFQQQNEAGNVLAAKAVKAGGAAAALAKMAFGSWIGADVTMDAPFDFGEGSILVETREPVESENWIYLGKTIQNPVINLNNTTTTLDEAFKAWTSRYDALYPRAVNTPSQETSNVELFEAEPVFSRVRVEKPVVVIPVFPGQNCEFDTAAKFERAGAEVRTIVFNNLNVESLAESIDTLADEIAKAQIFMLVGGFSLADEPDGSGKFIVSVLRNPKIAAAIEEMRANDGLILGICNGFQALVKSGLLPYGDVRSVSENSPTLFRNDINRHVSRMASTRITSNASPWLQNYKPGDVFSVAFSHGEGKFMASEEVLEKLAANGQIATQYVDESGMPTQDGRYNINGSAMAIEGILSEDGHIFGKMGHSERYEDGLFQNIYGNRDQNIFENGVRFFTHEI